MKRLALALASTLALASSSFAWVGGPWSYNQYYGDQIGGTWQGTFTGKGVLGITFFGTNPTSEANVGVLDPVTGVFGNNGVAVTFVDGEMIVGPSSHTSDFANRKLTGAFSGSKVTEVVDFVSQGLRFTGTIRLSGYFLADLEQMYPVVGYRGKGELTIKRADDPQPDTEQWNEDVDTVKIRVTGARTSTTVPVIVGTFVDVYPGFEGL